MQEFSKYRALRLLKAIYDRVGTATFEEFYEAHTGLFEDFAPDDGIGPGGEQEHSALAGVTITLEEIASYRPGRKMP